MKVLRLLDSGAFSAKNLGKPIDLDQYIEFVHRYGEHFEGYFNLDILDDGAGSYRNWVEMRRQGLQPVPVYHVSTEVKWLRRYLRRTNRIAVGSMAGLASRGRSGYLLFVLTRLWNRYLLDDQGSPKYRVHGLGVSSPAAMLDFPWYSMDSSVVSKKAGYGQVLIPNSCFGNGTPGYLVISVSPKKLHKVRSRSYYAKPSMIRRRIDSYVRDQGFVISPVLGPRDEQSPEVQDRTNLCHSNGSRVRFNYLTVEAVARQVGVRFYHAGMEPSVLAGQESEQVRVLSSYFYLRRSRSLEKVLGVDA